VPSNYVAQLLADGCTQLWLLDDASGPAASNSVGGGLAMAYGGTFSLGAPGIIPGHTSCRFTSGYATTAADPLVTPFRYTWSCLIRCAAAPVNCTFWDYASGGNGNTEYSLMSTQADTTLNISQTSAANVYYQLFSWPSIGNSAWHQVVTSWDGTNLKCYLDGALAGIQPAPLFFRGGAVLLGIGGMPQRVASAGTRFNGYMCAAAVWTSAVSDAVIANQYTVLAAEATGPVGQPATSGQIQSIQSQLTTQLAQLALIYAAVHKTYP